jgi:hypothetical protein
VRQGESTDFQWFQHDAHRYWVTEGRINSQAMPKFWA